MHLEEQESLASDTCVSSFFFDGTVRFYDCK